MSCPLFVNWHTPEYADDARRLRASLERFGLPHRIECTPSLGSWGRNCCYKPTFLQEMLTMLPAQHPGLVWLDADAELAAPPALFLRLAGLVDLAYCERPLSAGRHPEGQTGSLYLGITPRLDSVVDFLYAWAQRCTRVYCYSDQSHFNELAAAGGLVALAQLILPRTYCVMPEDPQAGAVILQHQASRRMVAVVGSEPPPPLPGVDR